ncbi:MAG TPA: lipopolysaccharide biosynthesis protein [Steroidobacteraceae bacterium]|nr:lipopolysaccharide biosynthesis protein [Steroidobacteraceae bacterium]
MNDRGLFARTVINLRWFVLWRTMAQTISWVLTLIVIRLLRSSDYGIMSMAGLVTIFLQLVLETGLRVAFVQRQCTTEEEYRAANTVLIAGATASVLVIQLAARPVAVFFRVPLLEEVLRLYALQFFTSALCVVPGAILTAQMRFRELGGIQSATGITAGVTTLVLAICGAGVWSLVIGILVGGWINVILLVRNARSPLGLSLKISLLRPYARFSWYMVVQRVIEFWIEEADQLFIGKWLGAAPLGIYSVARNLAQMPLDKTGGLVNQVSLPSFAAVQGDMKRWSNGYLKFIRLISALAFPVFWGMAATGPVALPIILGQKWASTVVPFVLICIPLPLRAARSLSTTALLGLGRSDVSFKTIAAWAGILTPLLFVGVHYGMIGVACAWAFGFPVVYLCYVLIVSKELHMTMQSLLAPMAVPATAGAASAMIAGVIGWMTIGRMPAIVILPLQMVSGLLCYILVVRTRSGALYAEISELLAQLLGRRRFS